MEEDPIDVKDTVDDFIEVVKAVADFLLDIL